MSDKPPSPFEGQLTPAGAADIAEARLVADVLRLARNPKADLDQIRTVLDNLDPADALRVSDRVAEALRQQGARSGRYETLDRALPYLPGQGPLERKALEDEAQIIRPTLTPDAQTVQHAIARVLDDRKPGTQSEINGLKVHSSQALWERERMDGPVQLTPEIRITAGRPPGLHDIDQFEGMVRRVQDHAPGAEVRQNWPTDIGIPKPPPRATQSTPDLDAPAIEITRRGDNGAPTQPDPPSVTRNYVVQERDGTRFYYQADDGQLAIRSTDQRIEGMLRDGRTIGTLLDLAAARGWDDVQIKGDREIARETWIEATARGIKAEGYAPSRDDRHHAMQRRIDRQLPDQTPPPPRMTPPPLPEMRF